MKIMSLNTWGGRAGRDKILNFFDSNKDAIDIFCLQEMWSAPYVHLEGSSVGGLKIKNDNIMVYGVQDISSILCSHNLYFHPHHLDNYGLVIFVNKNIKVLESGELFVYKYKGYAEENNLGNHACNIQYIKIEDNGKIKNIINFHGLWNGMGKGDTEDRILQSQNILDFIKTLEGEVVLCGDFNLLPETKSLKMFEEYGLINLIKEYNIQSTRTSYYTKPEKFADYVFVSRDVVVRDFKVLPDEVSDHSPLHIDIE